MRIIVVTFYDKENGQFYHAMRPCSGDTKAIRDWLEDNIKSRNIQIDLSCKHRDEKIDYRNILKEGCPREVIELLEEMYKRDFYYCSFENFDYMIEEYEI